MSPFNLKSWFNRQPSQPSTEKKEDLQQTFILEPIYTPGGLLDGGDDSEGMDLGPVDDPMDDLGDVWVDDEPDVSGDDGEEIGDEGDPDIEEDVISEGGRTTSSISMMSIFRMGRLVRPFPMLRTMS